ncbi:MAG: phosphoribosylformylglycinamidine synthase subunit PurS [Nitriliruptor sp.]|uniref:phosphoribosylformylglycinamidine synthase subunit PurS n=1 Tax=Nitriliruptor sp. TaxID=2448056 RepID=UPI0034A060BC
MPRVAIDVLLKHEILDPQGRAVEDALPGLGFDSVSDVRIGKHLELDVEAADHAELETLVTRMCADFLTNPVIESYTWRVLDGATGGSASATASGSASATA